MSLKCRACKIVHFPLLISPVVLIDDKSCILSLDEEFPPIYISGDADPIKFRGDASGGKVEEEDEEDIKFEEIYEYQFR